MPDKIRAWITIGGGSADVDLLKVGLDDDRRPWRVEAAGAPWDGWLMSDAEILEVVEGDYPVSEARCSRTTLPYPDAVERARCARAVRHAGPHEAYVPSRGVIAWPNEREQATA